MRIVMLFFLTLCLILSLSGRAANLPPPFLSQNEQQWLEQHPDLVFAFLPDAPPLSQTDDNGNTTGFLIDFYALLNEKLNTHITLIFGSTKNNVSEAIKKKITGIAVLPQSKELQQHFLFSKDIVETSFAVFSRKTLPAIQSLDDLKGKRLGLISAMSRESVIRSQYPGMQTIGYSTSQDLFHALDNNEIDAIYCELIIGKTLLELKNPYGLIMNWVDTKHPLKGSIAIRNDWPELVTILNKALQKITVAEKQRLFEKWLSGRGQDISMVKLTQQEHFWLQDHPTINLGWLGGVPPFIRKNSQGEQVGFLVDFVRLVSQKLNKPLHLSALPAGAYQTALKTHRIDGDLMRHYHKTYTDRGLFTEAYLSSTWGIYTLKNKPEITSFSQLYGQRLAMSVNAVSSRNRLKTEHPQIEQVVFTTMSAMFNAVRSGDCVGLYLGQQLGDAYLTNNFVLDMKFNWIDPASPFPIHMVIRKDWPMLVRILNKALAAITPEEKGQLYTQWFSRAFAEQYKAQLASNLQFTAREKRWIQQNPIVTFSHDFNWAPFIHIDANHNRTEVTGISKEFLDIVAEKTGLSFHYSPTEKGMTVLSRLKTGDILISPAANPSDEKKATAAFTKPYLTSPMVVVTGQDIAYLQDISELSGKKIAVPHGFDSYHYLREQYPNQPLIETRDVPEALHLVATGEADAFVGNLAVASYFLKELGLFNLKVSGTLKYEYNVGFMVSQQQTQLLSILNKVLASIDKKHRQHMINAWFAVQVEEGIDPDLVWKIVMLGLLVLVIFMAVISVIMYWNRRLNTEIVLRKETEAKLIENSVLLAQASHEAHAANKAKSAFLANMSHELRTPLNAILGFSQILQQSTRLFPDDMDSIKIINHSGEYLLSLINDVLDMSKIEAGKTTLYEHHFDFHQLLDDITDLFALRAEKKGLAFVIERRGEIPHCLYTDGKKIRQVLINLIGNAMKFTQQGAIKVCVEAQYKHSDRDVTVHFEVKDTGAGISQEEIPKLFEAFGQTQTGRASQEGTGLGLPISLKFVQLMGGNIEAHSEVGIGSQFVFSIQARQVEKGEEIATEKPRSIIALAPNQTPFRILIVDDVFNNRQLLTRLLHPLGFELQEANDGQQAVEAAASFQPHLIWMDVRMSVMDGLEATRRIKATPNGKNITIIILSASTSGMDKQDIFASGCDDFCLKPFKNSHIFELMHQTIGVRYVYADEGENTPEKNVELTAEALTQLSNDTITQILDACYALDMESLEKTVDEMKGQNESLANALLELIQAYEYDNLEALMTKTQALKSENPKGSDHGNLLIT